MGGRKALFPNPALFQFPRRMRHAMNRPHTIGLQNSALTHVPEASGVLGPSGDKSEGQGSSSRWLHTSAVGLVKPSTETALSILQNLELKDTGTTPTDRGSAEDIIKHGVELDFGRGMQDFSHKDGFYISPLFANAVNWACNQKRENPAIIIYKLKFNITIFRELELSSNQAEWEMIIKYNRSGRQTTTVSKPMIPDQNLLRRFNESEYVVGPVNGGKAGVRCTDKNWNSWKPSGFRRPHQQLCIKSERLAEVISDIRNIDAVIFYSSNTK